MSSTLYVPFHFIFVYVNLTIVMFITGRLRQNDAFFFGALIFNHRKLNGPPLRVILQRRVALGISYGNRIQKVSTGYRSVVDTFR